MKQISRGDCITCDGSGLVGDDARECDDCWGHGDEDRVNWLIFDAGPGPLGTLLVSPPLAYVESGGYRRSYLGLGLYLVRDIDGRFVEIEDDSGRSVKAGAWTESEDGSTWRLTLGVTK